MARKQSSEAQPSGEVAQSSHVSQLKRAEKRQTLVSKGLDSLDLWLNDLVRNGLASVQTQPASFWESKAAQMVDAQVPGSLNRATRTYRPRSNEINSKTLQYGLRKMIL